MNQKNIAIGVLSVTAVVLLCTLILVTETAQARATLDKGGQYTMAAGNTSGDTEGLYVLNHQTNGLVLYHYDPSTRKLAALPADLSEAFNMPGAGDDPRDRGRNPRRR